MGVLAGPPRAGAAPAPPVEVVLDWLTSGLGAQSPTPIVFQPSAPAGVTPPKDLQAPHFAHIHLPDGRAVAIAFDAIPAHPQLWIDADLDGDLGDETDPLLTRVGSSWSRRQFLPLAFEDDPGPLPLPIDFVHTPALGATHMTWSAEVHRRGRVVLGGRVREVILQDGNGDLRFDDAEHDRILLDLDGDGAAHTSGDAERIRPGTPFRLGEEGWAVRPASASGRTLGFVPAPRVPPAAVRPWCDRAIPPAGVARHAPLEPYAQLLARFESEREETFENRLETLQWIGDVGSAESFAFLSGVASSETDARVATAALRAMGNPAYLGPGGSRILAMARTASGEPAAVLTRVLHEMGHPEREVLYLDMIRMNRRGAAAAAAPWLAFLDTARARKSLLALAREGDDPGLRTTAYVQGLRNLRGGPPLELMLAAAGDEYLPLRAEAILDLARLAHPTARARITALAREDRLPPAVVPLLARALGALGDTKAVRALLDLLEVERLPAAVPSVVIEQLAPVREPKSLAAILKELKSHNPLVRTTVIQVLAGNLQPDVTEALLQRARKEKEPAVLSTLFGALGRHRDERAIPLLLEHADDRSPDPASAAAIRGLMAFGLGHPKVRPLLLRLLASKHIEQRLTALERAKELDDPEVVAQVVATLEHEAWTVRLAAVGTLDAIRPRAAVAPLIARLEAEAVKRVKDAIPPVLFHITGMNLYDDPITWRRWYEEAKDTFVVPTEVPQLPAEPAGGTVATFYGIPVKTNRVVFVIDRSGSMTAESDPRHWKDGEVPNRYEIAVQETLGALEKLDENAEVNVILFNATIHAWRTSLQRLTRTSRSAIAQHLRTTKPVGGTNVYDGLEMALRMPEVDTIFLLSDGEPRSGTHVGAGAILGAVRGENASRRVALHCVSIGTDSDLLRRLARENGGMYVRR